jgi:magnesium chelatase subunit H
MASKRSAVAVPMHVVLVTLDAHVAGAFERARTALERELPGLTFDLHVAADFATDVGAVERANASIARADVLVLTQLFTEESAKPIMAALQARAPHCDVVATALCAPDVMKLNRLGKFSMAASDEPQSPWSPMALLKKLRGSREDGKSAGERQLTALKQLPKLLRFIPGTAQDVRAWMLVMQYWLAGSEANLTNLVRLLVNRYAAGPRAVLKGTLKVADPEEYPEVGCYHPSLPSLGLTASRRDLPARGKKGTVGVLVGRSYLLAGNTAHYNAVITALEARDLNVVPVFASGLDARPAIERFFLETPKRGAPRASVDAMVSLTGFSLVGGPAYNDAEAAQAILSTLDVPYLSLQTLEFQTLSEWEQDPRGLNALQATLQVAIPELDGATSPLVYGGKGSGAGTAAPSEPIVSRIDALADRVAKRVALRRSSHEARKVAIILFNFPPNAGNTGSAAYLGVFESLFNVMSALKRDGYDVDLPENTDALRQMITEGNALETGAPANVHARISASDVGCGAWPSALQRARTLRDG